MSKSPINFLKDTAVLVPSFNCSDETLELVDDLIPLGYTVILIDDCCPRQIGALVKEKFSEFWPERLVIVEHELNQGVGGATIAGIEIALKKNCEYMIKFDGDGQFDTGYVAFVRDQLVEGHFDIVKGNRFLVPGGVIKMPMVRRIGNLFLNLLVRLSTGHWNIGDPTNGLVGMTAELASLMQLNKLEKRYAFETSLMGLSSIMGAKVGQIPTLIHHYDGPTSMKPFATVLPLSKCLTKIFFQRIATCYFGRDVNLGSVWLVIFLLSFTVSVGLGYSYWTTNTSLGQPSLPGEVALALLPAIITIQSLIGFLIFDATNEVKESLTSRIQLMRGYVDTTDILDK